MRIVWQRVSRFTDEILGVKGLSNEERVFYLPNMVVKFRIVDNGFCKIKKYDNDDDFAKISLFLRMIKNFFLGHAI